MEAVDDGTCNIGWISANMQSWCACGSEKNRTWITSLESSSVPNAGGHMNNPQCPHDVFKPVVSHWHTGFCFSCAANDWNKSEKVLTYNYYQGSCFGSQAGILSEVAVLVVKLEYCRR